jgi:hypothetical protein
VAFVSVLSSVMVVGQRCRDRPDARPRALVAAAHPETGPSTPEADETTRRAPNTGLKLRRRFGPLFEGKEGSAVRKGRKSPRPPSLFQPASHHRRDVLSRLSLPLLSYHLLLILSTCWQPSLEPEQLDWPLLRSLCSRLVFLNLRASSIDLPSPCTASSRKASTSSASSDPKPVRYSPLRMPLVPSM